MKTPKKTIYFVILFLPILVISCAAPIPMAENPAEIERTFNAPLEEVWNSVVKAVQYYGILITEDKPSGLIVFTYGDNRPNPTTNPTAITDPALRYALRKQTNQLYMTVYLKSHPITGTTDVYLIANSRIGYLLRGIEKDFFNKVEENLRRK